MKRFKHFLRLHDWQDVGTFVAENRQFTRQVCTMCPKSRVNLLP